MLEKGDRVLLGVSGGADSMCLLSVLDELKSEYDLSLYVVHVNHMIRGTEADEDEEYVRDYCKMIGIPMCARHENVRKMAKEHGWSEEEAGRNARYAAFYEECKRNSCHKIAIAHNMNDNAETILFHLFRGTGLQGLTGIAPLRDNIIRPLLSVTREEIEEYLQKKNIQFRTDSTNLSEDYARNKIRHSILPYASREINARATEHIVTTAIQLSEAADYIDQVTTQEFNKTVRENKNFMEINLELFRSLPKVIQKSLVRKTIFLWCMQLKDIEEGHIMDVVALADKEVGKYIHLPYGIIAKKTYESIIISRNASENLYLQQDEKQAEYFLRCKSRERSDCDVNGKELSFLPVIPGKYEFPEYGCEIEFSIVESKNSIRIPKNGYTKLFDYDKIKTAVEIRNRKTGDFLQINKHGGKKSLKSVFIDSKVPKEFRDEIPLLCDGNHVLWVFGGRTSEAYLVEESTSRVLMVEVKRKRCNIVAENIKVLISEDKIEQRIKELGEEISKVYEDKPLHLICILKGGAFFMTELSKHITVPLSIDFMSVSSYGDALVSSGRVKIVKDLDDSIEGKDVLIVEDIIDSGRTLSYLTEMLKNRGPKSIKICTLLDKPDRRETEVKVEYTGFKIPDEFVVGYGLDYKQKYRNLPYVGVVVQE